MGGQTTHIASDRQTRLRLSPWQVPLGEGGAGRTALQHTEGTGTGEKKKKQKPQWCRPGDESEAFPLPLSGAARPLLQPADPSRSGVRPPGPDPATALLPLCASVLGETLGGPGGGGGA